MSLKSGGLNGGTDQAASATRELVSRRRQPCRFLSVQVALHRRHPSLAPAGCSGIVDYGSSHNGRASIDRLDGRWPNLRLIHLPIHASWLNQIEIYFSILQRKALTPNDFPDLAALAARIASFENHYRQIAQPFDWTFTRTDLDRVLAKVSEHEPTLALAA